MTAVMKTLTNIGGDVTSVAVRPFSVPVLSARDTRPLCAVGFRHTLRFECTLTRAFIHTQTDRQTGREADGQTDRDRDRETQYETQRDSETDRQTDRQ